MGGSTTDGDIYSQFMLLSLPIVWGPYDGRRYLFAVYVTFAPHRMGVRTTDGDIYLLL